ncbi:MAG: S-layer homology domain-containing protein [Oscillospiraceae bacterium]|nr:S-layer homology domain-containing protein [Oscillospiraceae bacterium]
MKRYTALTLVLCLLISLMPASAFAAEGDSNLQASTKIREMIKKYEGAYKDSYGNHVAYQDVYGKWTIGYGHTGYVPCRGMSVCSGMVLSQAEADQLLLDDLNKTYAPSVNSFVNEHRDKYPNGLTQYEFDTLVSFAYCFGPYWIDHYKDEYRLARYLLNGISNYSDAEIADAMMCLWSGLTAFLPRRTEEAQIFLYGDYEGTGPNRVAYLKFEGAETVFTEDLRSGNRVAGYIVGQPYGELPTAADGANGYFVGWKTPDGKILKNTDIVQKSMTVTAVWSSTKPAKTTLYKLDVVNGGGSGYYPAGASVKVSPSVRTTQEFRGWKGDVNPVKGSDGYYITMPARGVTLTASFGASVCPLGDDCPSRNFEDVSSVYWAHTEIDNVVSMGLFSGTSATSFEPDREMSRAMLVTVLYRLAGSPDVTGLENSFNDVVKNNYYNAILWAHANNIAQGYTDGSFHPNAAVTREQFVTFLQRFAKSIMGVDTEQGRHDDLSGFSDAGNVSEAFREAMSWAVGEGIVSGTSATTLSPKNSATRAQVAAILSRFTAE